MRRALLLVVSPWLLPFALLPVPRECLAQLTDPPPAVRFGEAKRMGKVASPLIDESSGVDASRRFTNCFWTHNDNGDRPGIFLVSGEGEHLATIQLAGAAFTDWEDISMIRDGDHDWIVVGDVGDNTARRPLCRLYLVEEPELELPRASAEPLEQVVTEFQTVTFRYPNGPVDCEAIAVEPGTRRVWLVSKQRPGGPGARMAGGKNGAYEKCVIHFLDVPEKPDNTVLEATRVESVFDSLFVTGLDFSPDGDLAVSSTLFTAHVFVRGNEGWEKAFAGRSAVVTPLPLRRQGEAICFDVNGENLILTSEGVGQSVWRIPIERRDDD